MSATGEARSACRILSDGLTGDAPGFTLLELLVALGIMALITGIGFPALQNRLNAAACAQAQTVVALAMAEARSDAVAGARTVRLSVSRDGSTLHASGGRSPVMLAGNATIAAPEDGFLFFPDGTARGGVGRVAVGPTGVRFTVDAMSGRATFLP